MLILTRRIGESIYIGDSVVVTVVDLKRNQVRLGIVAPRDLPVDREEIWLRKQQEQRAEAGSTGTAPV